MKYKRAKRDAKTGEFEIEDLDACEQIVDCVDDLLYSGLDEDAHFRGFWVELRDEDVIEVINDNVLLSRLMELLKPTIVKRLKQAVKRRKESS